MSSQFRDFIGLGLCGRPDWQTSLTIFPYVSHSGRGRDAHIWKAIMAHSNGVSKKDMGASKGVPAEYLYQQQLQQQQQRTIAAMDAPLDHRQHRRVAGHGGGDEQDDKEDQGCQCIIL